MRRRPFTLIELLMALFLGGILFSTLFFAYRQSVVTKASTARVGWPMKQRFMVHEQLEKVLPEISEVCHLEENSLVFTFNNGIDRDPPFCGKVISRLFVDQQNRLTLALWPDPDRWELDPMPVRQRVIASKVTDLMFTFYEPEDVEDPLVQADPITTGQEVIEPPKGWSQEWSPEYEQLPALINLTFYLSGTKVSLAYALPFADKPIRSWHLVEKRSKG